MNLKKNITSEMLSEANTLLSENSLSITHKINSICESEFISVSALQRNFNLSYPSAKNKIEEFEKLGLIKKSNTCYKILNKKALNFHLIQTYCNINKILPNNELKFYIFNFLINDDNFIKDMDLTMCNGQMAQMNKLKIQEYFDANIGNESRTYIIKLIALKHLFNILLENSSTYLDEFWIEKLNNIIK